MKPIGNGLNRDASASDRTIAAEEKSRAAQVLANKHYDLDDGLTRIFRITGEPDTEVVRGEPIKLLEVNENTYAAGIRPLHFGPSPASGIPYPLIIVEVTPDEFRKIESSELKLPNGWTIGEEFLRPSDAPGGA
jgi:hypothetical protein